MATAVVSSVLIHKFSPSLHPSAGRTIRRYTRYSQNLSDAFHCKEGSPYKEIRWNRGSYRVVARMVGRPASKRTTVIPDPDYRMPLVLLGVAGGLIFQDNLLVAVPVGLLGLLLLFQTTRVRFVFDDEALEVKVGNQLEDSGENVFVGGKNRWKYSTFVNWELWWPDFPILVYFKETQTKPEGQVHFFPVIFGLPIVDECRSFLISWYQSPPEHCIICQKHHSGQEGSSFHLIDYQHLGSFEVACSTIGPLCFIFFTSAAKAGGCLCEVLHLHGENIHLDNEAIHSSSHLIDLSYLNNYFANFSIALGSVLPHL